MIPFDEVVDAMYKIGKAMPAALRETSMGGLATTPTGETLRCRLIGKQ
jgi:L-serine dehydratase